MCLSRFFKLTFLSRYHLLVLHEDTILVFEKKIILRRTWG